MTSKLVVPFNKIDNSQIALYGGKVASLGEMFNNLSHKKIRIPNGFCVTSNAFHVFIHANNLEQKIFETLNTIDFNEFSSLQKASRKIKKFIIEGKYPEPLESKIIEAFTKLCKSHPGSVAVRSSATCEDLTTISFAGLHDSFVHISTPKNLLISIKKAFASLYNERAIAYRHHHDYHEKKVAMAVGIQAMVRSDNATSGVMFTLDTESGFDKVVLINALYGLGEGLVSGKITPDEFLLFKTTLSQNKRAILSKKLGRKTHKLVYSKGKSNYKSIPTKLQHQFCLTDAKLTELAKFACIIEQHYGKPMDIEWAEDSHDGKLYIVQARPETVTQQQNRSVITEYKLLSSSKILCQGKSVGNNIGQGIAQIIHGAKNINQFQAGSVLVTDSTDPDWEPIMKKASAIVTNRGGRTCHAAIIARELGIPAVIGTLNATEAIKNRQAVTVSCAEGETGFVYTGLLKFKTTNHNIQNLPKIPVKISMNLGNPEKAFTYQGIPNQGVGLARIEFIISNMIGIHPNAAINYRALPKNTQKIILSMASAYKNPQEFYIEKLREGMATIAAAFYPKEVIFRFSDFKSNEYANLIGGKSFEPTEENPMLGFRGASRYATKQFQACFALECQAIKRVREDCGLMNAQVMIPFVRTVHEAKSVVDLMKTLHLKRGKNNLKIYMMCEIPSNALLAEDFLQYFDGFSIGSNDLTQLTLGIDRDSELIAPSFDERDLAVKKLLSLAIKACKKANKYVGICGQGPSDKPDFAEWLVKEGINNLSLNPDSIIPTWLTLSKKIRV